MPVKKSTTPTELFIPQIEQVEEVIPILGVTGLYCHRMTQKAQNTLLLGGRKKTVAERGNTIKHHPREEFLASMYIDTLRHPAAVVFFPAMAFKRSMRTVAADIAGVKGTEIDRLIFIAEEFVPIYGVPRLRMDVARSSDIGRTPDVRTRAYFAEWATELRIRYAKPKISRKTLFTLLNNAGLAVGVGDNRQERGHGNFGTFRTAELEEVQPLCDLDAQQDALESPQPDNAHGDTAVLLAQYDQAVLDRA